jgi:hypothetical protein
LCKECFAQDPFRGMAMPRLLVMEVAKSAIRSEINKYSYDQLASESGNEDLVRNPFTIRFLAGKQGRFDTDQVSDALVGMAKRIKSLPKSKFSAGKADVLQRFIYERLDGMVKQPKGSVLDALMDAEIQNFASRLGASLADATVQGLPSAFNVLVGKGMAGVNVEVPYVICLLSGKRILVHRVNANDGHAADKRKEFSSKIRSIRYHWRGQKCEMRADIAATVLVLDGKWIPETNADPLSHIRMLTVAGWDYVVYPDQLAQAFALIEKSLKSETGKTATPMDLSDDEELAMAAEEDVPQKLTKRRKSNGR